MSRQDSQEQQMLKNKSQKVFPLLVEECTLVPVMDVESAVLRHQSTSESEKSRIARGGNGGDKKNPEEDDYHFAENTPKSGKYNRSNSRNVATGSGESGNKKISGNNEPDDDDDDDHSSEVILVDEVKNKGGVITRSKAKSVGQVDYMATLRRRSGKSPRNFRKAISEEGKLNEFQAEDLERRLKALAAAFSARTIRTKKKIQQPPTPSSEESESEDAKIGEPTLLDRLRQLASPGPSEFGDSRRKSITEKVKGTFTKNLSHLSTVLSCNYILDPQSSVYIGWLLVVSIVFLYNAWVIPLRVVFPYQTESNVKTWIVFDCLADTVYLIDLLAFKPHVKFILNGFWVKEPKETLWSYLRTIQFKLDLVALLPADIAVSFFGKNFPLLRLPRFLKIQTFWELFRQLDTYLAHPHRARIFHTCLYMLYMIHMVACSYYAVSTWEGIKSTTWTFDGQGNAYIRCFYFATKTATSIGKNPKPENELEYMFMTFAWLSGVFVFAILIGQIRDIIATATKSQTEYRILTSAAISYLHQLGVPDKLQNRVKLWLSYTWEQQKTLDERRILNLLPKNMKAEIALNIHVETLAKVKLFQNCETAFLRDLVVKLRSIIILPGDLVCRKGEIGREMFIVKSGKIQVIGGPSGTQVLATLGEGSVFGEIALLGIGGMNKRTADVRAAGFSNLFVLNKADLNDVIRDYPEAQEIIQRKAKKLMRESIKKARTTPSPTATSDDCVSLAEESGVIIKNKTEAPKLISTILKLFPPTTKIGRYLTQGSKVSSCSDVSISSTSNKPGDTYTSLLNSYPPSPFIPASPGHISPELDISIMTGDSSEKMLSPPPESQQDLSDGITLSSEDGYRSDQLDHDGKIEHIGEERFSLGHFDKEREVKQRRSAEDLPSGQQRNSVQESKLIKPPRPSSDKLQTRCTSPLPPYLRQDEIQMVRHRRGSFLPDVALLASSAIGNAETLSAGLQRQCKEPEQHHSHFDSMSVHSNLETDREEIPIQQRPPLYIIEPGVYTLDEKNKLSFGKRKKGSIGSTGSRGVGVIGAVVIDSSLEEDLGKSFDMEKETHNSGGKISEVPRKLVKKDVEVVKEAASSSTFAASHFISKVRKPLQRQAEMEVHDGSSKVKSVIGKKEQGNVESMVSSYSVDLESD